MRKFVPFFGSEGIGKSPFLAGICRSLASNFSEGIYAILYLAYVAQMGEKWFVSVDGQAEQPYDGIVTIGGGRIFFASPQTPYYLGVKGPDIYLVGGKVK